MCVCVRACAPRGGCGWHRDLNTIVRWWSLGSRVGRENWDFSDPRGVGVSSLGSAEAGWRERGGLDRETLLC